MEFDRALNAASRPAGSAFRVSSSGDNAARRDIYGIGTATVAGTLVEVTLPDAVPAARWSTTVTYYKPASAPLQGADEGHPAVPKFEHFDIGYRSWPARLESAATEDRGRGLWLAFTKAILVAGVHTDYTVRIDGERRATRQAFWEDNRVGLLLAEPVRPGETVTVAYANPNACWDRCSIPPVPGQTVRPVYTMPSGGVALRDADDLAIESFGPVSVTNSVSVEPENRAVTGALTAAFVGVPAEHDGRAFSFELAFSEDFPGRLRYKLLRDHAFRVANGRVTRARRVARGQNRRWTIKVKPDSYEDVTVTLPAGSVTTDAGRTLADSVSATVRGPAALSVSDARAEEGSDAALEFAVRLSRSASSTVTVDYATADGTAKAGEDYTAISGTLTFAVGETSKTVSVPVLDDLHDEGEETLTLTLSNAAGARLANGEATGTIANTDPLQRMWLSRFGRTVASQVTDAVSNRLADGLAPEARATLAGQGVDLSEVPGGKALADTLTGLARVFGAAGASPAAGDPFVRQGLSGSWKPPAAASPARRATDRELVLGSSFHLAGADEGPGPRLAAWGRVVHGSFDGIEGAAGARTSMDGEVFTGTLGADADFGRVLAGVAVSLSEGEGTFSQTDVASGTVGSTVTTVSPYARVALTRRVLAWGLFGWGAGAMTVVQDAHAPTGERTEEDRRITKTDLSMQFGAIGARGDLLTPGAGGGMDLALKADGYVVRTETDQAANLAATKADASRLRLVLEGGRGFALEEGVTFRPSLELGVRHDGGDAETGTAVELAGGVSYSDAALGLSIEAKARMLVAHADSDYGEWGMSASVRLASRARGHGPSFTLSPTLGAAASGADRLWDARHTRALAPNGTFQAVRELTAEAGYGMALFGDRFTVTPNLAFGVSDSGAYHWRVGWRLTSAATHDPGFEVSLDATRRDAASGGEHGVMLRSLIRW